MVRVKLEVHVRVGRTDDGGGEEHGQVGVRP